MNHDEIVELAEKVADYYRQLVRENLPPEVIAQQCDGFRRELFMLATGVYMEDGEDDG